MRKVFKEYRTRGGLSRILLMATLMLFGIAGCQDEGEEISTPPVDKVILPNSVVAGLIGRVSLRDGSPDNILDHCSCTTLVLPVTVIANGQEVIVNTAADFQIVRQILGASADDVDIVLLVFPVTVTLADHSEATINSQEELQAIIDQCQSDGGDDDIECIDFKYPVTFSIYDSDNQLTSTLTINNDEELYSFFKSMKSGDLVGIKYPIELVLSGGSTISVTGNDALKDAIENAIYSCDEGDNSYEQVNSNDDIISILTGSEWKIVSFFSEGDKTGAFDGYVFSFYPNGNAVATNGVTTINGTWESKDDYGKAELNFDFNGPDPWGELHEDWRATEISDTTIKLSHDGMEHMLTFGKN